MTGAHAIIVAAAFRAAITTPRATPTREDNGAQYGNHDERDKCFFGHFTPGVPSNFFSRSDQQSM